MLGVPTETQSEVPCWRRAAVEVLVVHALCWRQDRAVLPVDALALGVALEPDERVPSPPMMMTRAPALWRWPFLYVAVGNSETCAIIELPASENFMLKPGPRSGYSSSWKVRTSGTKFVFQ